MEYDLIFNGEKVFTGDTADLNHVYLPKKLKFPRMYSLENIPTNKDIYEPLLNQVGKTVRVESDIFDGFFKVDLIDDELILTEDFFLPRRHNDGKISC